MNSNIAADILSPEQEYALEKFKKGENVFITGPGGTGKTRFIKHVVSHMKNHGISYQVCALTGCAAVLLQCEARTLHSWSGIRLAKDPIGKIVTSVSRSKKSIKEWKRPRVLIIDEVSMMSKKIFELIELLGRTIRRNSAVFGGIQVIFTGDFFQLPPVPNYEDPDSSKFAFESEKWRQVFKLENHIELKTMFRQKDPIYINILQEIRKGELSDESRDLLKTYVKREYHPEEHNGCVPTKLFAVRSKTDFVNTSMYNKIEEPEYSYSCIEKTDCKMYLDTCKPFEREIQNRCDVLSAEERGVELEFLLNNTNTLKTNVLKKGALVMCTYNLDVESEICNGSQGRIVDFKKNSLDLEIPVVLFSNGIRRAIDYQYIQSDEYPCVAVGQIPLCLAWALTIHKIQGATMDMADMDLGYTIFEFGQTYVALSRIKALEGLYLSAFHPHRIKANPIVKKFYEKIPALDLSSITIPVTTSEPTIESNSNPFSQFSYQEEEESTVKRIHL